MMSQHDRGLPRLSSRHLVHSSSPMRTPKINYRAHLDMDPGSRHMMDLCAFCLELVQAISSSDEGRKIYEFERPIDSSCNFCEQLTQSRIADTFSDRGLRESLWKVDLRCSESLMHNEDNLCCRITIRIGKTWLEFSVWADECINSCYAFFSLLTRDQGHPPAKDSSNVRRSLVQMQMLYMV
jgi:hypothetical protein